MNLEQLRERDNDKQNMPHLASPLRLGGNNRSADWHRKKIKTEKKQHALTDWKAQKQLLTTSK